ncbi:MAG: hypothetical protein R6X29_03625 [Acidimicrobiia bacterium]
MSRALVTVLVLVVAACAPQSAPTTTAPTTTTTRPPETTTTMAPGDGSVVLPVASGMGAGWIEAFVIPYGDTPDTLGVSLGGDGEGLLIGPDYGARMSDGTWWFLDSAKARLAHFDGEGAYLGEVPMPEELLVNGEYFQYTLPRGLEDGTLVAVNANFGGETSVLRLRDGIIDAVRIPGEWISRYDDGKLLYAFTFENELLVVDVDAATAEPTEWFLTRPGARFGLVVEPGELRLDLPDVPQEVVIPVEAPPEIGGTVYVSAEVVSTADGSLHLFLLGLADADESIQLAGYLTVGPDGSVSAVEPVRDPFTEADPGSPSRLGVRPGTDEVSFMFIDPDGVRVFRRAG